MAGDVIRLVDSIASSPTVRLDLNDEVSWWVKSFSAPPPRLRRSQSSNAMRDGVHVATSNYEARTLTIELQTIKATQDLGATEIQKLWRELDRADNILMYQPTGATKPVFFRTFRSDTSQLEDIIAQAAMRDVTIEILAEPFALGLKESLGPYTVNNNPAAGSNPCYFDVTGAIGDVPAPLVWWDLCSSSHRRRIVATQHKAAAADLEHVWIQAEGATVNLDTSGVAGGPDAAMSGTGTNNYTQTTFAGTPTMSSRMTWNSGINVTGQWRVIAFARKNGTTSTLTARAQYTPSGGTAVVGSTMTIAPATSGRLSLDLGVFNFGDERLRSSGQSAVENSITSGSLAMQAARSGGSDTLDWDAFLLLPAGGQRVSVATPSTTIVDTVSSLRTLLDTARDQAAGLLSAGDPTTGASSVSAVASLLSGGLPYIAPGALVSNRFHVIPSATSGASPVATTTTVTLAYWPRYLLVRPATT